MDLFAAKGFDTVTADHIAGRAGVSRATFFNYFPQKELILAEFARSRVDRVQALIGGGVSSHLKALLNLFLAFAAENEELLGQNRSLLPQIILRPSSRSVLLPMVKRLDRVLTDALERSGELAPGVKASTLAESLFAVYAATTLQWALHPDPPSGWQRRKLRERLSLLIRMARKEGKS